MARDRRRERSRSPEVKRERPRSRSSDIKRERPRSRSPEIKREFARSPDRRRRRRSRTRTPEKRRSPRKYKYWDVPPVGYEKMEPKEYKELQASGKIPRAALQSSVPVVGPLVTCQSRRLYVGNIPFGCSEEAMLDFFNQQMHLCGLAQAPGSPVLACQINLEKNFAFIEFRSIDETTAGMAFNGIAFMGQQLKIHRPREYQPVNTSLDVLARMPVSNIVVDSPNKIFISGLPKILIAEQVKELLSSFGQLKAFNLVIDQSTKKSKGFAFCEYIDSSLTNQAIAGLNGMQVGENKLLVQLSCPNSRPMSQQYNAPTVQIDLSKGIGPATEVLCLFNMITEEDLANDEEYEDILEDIRSECAKHGTVISLEIPRPIPDQEVKGVGKVFVEFQSPSECQTAQAALTGRRFADRIVVTSYYDSDQYHRREF